ncbi:MAG: hypothetical protein AB7F79_00395 [Steroidobacteraceae bacterium]
MDNQTGIVQLRLEIATQMICYEARTSTIRLATGLTEDQIRRLYRLARKVGSVTLIQRHRGRSPTRAAQYTRNAGAQLEASILASVLAKHALLRDQYGSRSRNVYYAQRFCTAYGEYLLLAHQQPLTFEQAWHFAHTLVARRELYLQHCARCASHFVRNNATVLRGQCPFCRLHERSLGCDHLYQ